MDKTCKYDIKGFSCDLGLPLEDIADLYCDFLNEINSEISKLKKLIVEKDLESIKKVIHDMKGLSISFRISDIYKETDKINTALKLDSFDNIEPIIINLFYIYEDAVKEILKYFEYEGFDHSYFPTPDLLF
jgi:hypothetical protein